MTVKIEKMEVSDISEEMHPTQESDQPEETIFENNLTGKFLDDSQDDINLSDVELIKHLTPKDDNKTKPVRQLALRSQNNRMSIALGVLFRLVLPLCNGVARGFRGIGGLRLLRALRNIVASRQTLTNMLAYAANTISLSLSSVQVVHRIDPILKIVKLKKGSTTKSIASTTATEYFSSLPPPPPKHTEAEIEEYENRITMNILAEPPADMAIRADIIFIHGLHGSLVNTWKQGLWNKTGKPVEFERPPRPPLRPPKRPRHSRSNIFEPPHSIKRRRYSEEQDHFVHFERNLDGNHILSCNYKTYMYECSSPKQTDFCDGVEFSFTEFGWTEENRKDSVSSQGSSESFNSDQDKCDIATNEEEKNELSKSDSYSFCWPGDWLPIDCPGVRVIALNYTTDPYLWRPVWVRKRKRTTMTERARKMTEMLIEKRVGHGRPIIWVGHSKGGLFIKQILIDAWESGRIATAPLWKSSRGVFFYSVPHRGSPLADFSLPFLRQSIELKEIGKNCDSVLELHRRFVALYQSGNLKIEVFSFVETALTLMSVLYLRIVGVDSADPGIGEVCGVHLDHREVCKPRSRNCILYTELIKMIKKII